MSGTSHARVAEPAAHLGGRRWAEQVAALGVIRSRIVGGRPVGAGHWQTFAAGDVSEAQAPASGASLTGGSATRGIVPRRTELCPAVFRAASNAGGQAISRDLRVNQMIRIPQVRVVDEEGAQLGVMPTPQALAMAQERGYDLVEVAPMASPPVVKFLDFGQYKYELTKREKEAKRRQRSVTFKEVRLTPKIGTGDFDTKVHRAIEFLEDGDRIKVTVRFRGRELTHPELGRNMLSRFTDRIKDHGTPERAPLLEGKSMHLTVASTHKPKEHDVSRGEGANGAERRSRSDRRGARPAAGTRRDSRRRQRPLRSGRTGQTAEPKPADGPGPRREASSGARAGGSGQRRSSRDGGTGCDPAKRPRNAARQHAAKSAAASPPAASGE